MSESIRAEDRFSNRERSCPICGGWDTQERGKGKRCNGYYTGPDRKFAMCARVDGGSSYLKTVETKTGPMFLHLLRDEPLDTLGSFTINRSNSELKEVARYNYTNDEGGLLYQVRRFEPKTFKFFRPNGSPNHFLSGLGDQSRVMYRRHHIAQSDAGRPGQPPVFLTEGEKDADALAELGLQATTSSGGARSVDKTAEDGKRLLEDRRVCIIADKDDEGKAYVRDWLEALNGVALEVCVVEVEQGKDAADWIDAGAKPSDFLRLAEAGFSKSPEEQKKELAPPRLVALLQPTFDRIERRVRGDEKPIPLPWPVLANHFGGGLWPGVHYITKGTGIGGTQFTMQAVMHAARVGIPSLYIGLEMGGFDLGVRAIGLESRVPWSTLWTGTAGPAYMAQAREAIDRLKELPIHYETARPMGYSAADIVSAFERTRAAYPSDMPLLGVVDFLQLIGDAPGKDQELRQRIGNTSYVLRDIAVRLNIAVLAISSVAREKLRILPDIVNAAGLAWEEDDNGCPVDRRILDPDAIVGLGKESGEIEYSGDSVSVLARVPGTWDGHGSDIVFATAKGRATGAMWSPLRFTGFAYSECEDRGGRMVEVWKEKRTARTQARIDKAQAKEQAKQESHVRDASSIVRYVMANRLCSVRDARSAAVGDSSRRWADAEAVLGAALVKTKDGAALRLTIDESKLPSELR